MRGQWCKCLTVGLVVCVLMVGVSVPTCAQEKTAWDYIAVFAQGENGPGMEAQMAAIHSLVEIGEGAVAPLLSVLNHQNKYVRANVAMALGRMKATGAVEPLITMLQDAEPSVRGAVAEALGKIADPRAVQPLLAQLGKEDEADVRGAAVGLGWMKAKAAVQPLTGLLQSENWEVRWRAALALGQIGDKAAVEVLSALRTDTDVVVAASVLWAFGTLSGQPDFSGFQTNLKSEEAGVVYGSAWAVGVIGDAGAVNVLAAALQGDNETAQAASKDVLVWLDTPGASAALSKAAPAQPAE